MLWQVCNDHGIVVASFRSKGAAKRHARILTSYRGVHYSVIPSGEPAQYQFSRGGLLALAALIAVASWAVGFLMGLPAVGS